MKIFISWSGDPSHELAKALKTWLPRVFQSMDEDDVSLSSSDISLGSVWFPELARLLKKADFGVLCLTKENVAAPWVLFEAGAIAKRFDRARVAPLLIGLTENDVPSPLSHLQGAVFNRSGAERLVASINERLGTRKLSKRKLANAVERRWAELEGALGKVTDLTEQAAASAIGYDVFLSAPMAAFDDDAAFVAFRAEIKKLFDVLTKECGRRVYWAAEKVEHKADFETRDISALDDLRAIERSRYFMLVYPERMATSAIFEAGYALARGHVSHYFVRDRDHLPFLLQELPGAVHSVRIHEKQDWKDYDDLARKLKKNQDYWFPRS